ALVKTLQKKGIVDPRVLYAINKVPRHIFFDQAFLEHAYQDKAFPIGSGQTISQPYTVAVQTSLLDIKPGDKVLEVGTGSGYQCCILLELGAKVYTIEYVKLLHQKAKHLLPQLGYRANLFLGDGSKGLKAFAPYDKIVVTAGAPIVPKPLINQLKENGVIVIPVGDEKQQEMVSIKKTAENKLIKKTHNYFSFVPLVGAEGWK
ncbi:MAG: protein-L-isoaspartate(D-aspartate) O-methyltransferase, partial [Cyclobacteriaceae bacterium]